MNVYIPSIWGLRARDSWPNCVSCAVLATVLMCWHDGARAQDVKITKADTKSMR